MRVLLFGSLADITGKNELDIHGVESTDQLKDKIFSSYPLLSNHTFLIAVNKKVQQQNVSVSENDVVAMLPPYSGG
jgi:molybdopterin synthase sulfur carrier subunit